MFDIIIIDLWSSWNFVRMKKIIRTYNLTVKFSKFTVNIKIYEKFKGFFSKSSLDFEKKLYSVSSTLAANSFHIWTVWNLICFFQLLYPRKKKILKKKKKTSYQNEKKSGEKQIKFERVSDRVNPMGLRNFNFVYWIESSNLVH